MKKPNLRCLFVAVTALNAVILLPQSQAAVRTWSGAGADANWNTAANWGGTAPVNADTLVFSGTTQQNNTNNISNLSVNALSFANAGFTLNGNLMSLNGPLTNTAGINIFAQAVNVTAQNQTWNLAPGSELRISGQFTNSTTANPLATLGFGGTVRFTSSNCLPNRFFTLTSGSVIADGCILSTLDGFRIQPPTGSTAVFQITNNASFTIGSGGNLRLCQTATGGSSRVDMSSGILNMAINTGPGAGDIFVGEAASTTTVFNQNGGLVEFTGNGNNRIAFANASATANGTYNLNGGTLWAAQIVQVTAGSPGGTFNFNGGTLKPTVNSTTFFQGVQTANIQAGSAIIDTTNLSITIGEPLPGVGGLTKLGSGTLTLTGNNTYTGATVVSNGTLVTSASSFLGAGTLTVASNANLTITNFSGTPLLASTLNLGSSVTNSVTLNLGSAPTPGGNPVVAVTNLNGTGTALINILGSSFASGTYPLIAYTNGAGLTSIKLGSLPLGVSGTLVQSGNVLSLNVAYVPKNLEWSGNASPNWDTSAINWFDLNNGNNPTNYAQSGGNGDAVTFDDNGGANPNVTLGITVTPSQLTFNNNGVVYTFSGGGAISGGVSLIKGGFQPVTLGTVNNFSGGTILNAGTIYLAANQALGTGPVTLNLGTLASDSATPRTLANVLIQNAGTGIILGDTVNTGTLTLAGGLNLAGGARTLDFNSDVIVSGSLTNGGIGTKTGPGTLIFTGQGSVNAQATQTGGNTLINGGTLVQTGDGWRMQDLVPGTTMDFAVTNGGSFIMTNLIGGNFRLGLAGEDTSTSYILDVAGTMVVYAPGNPAGVGHVFLGIGAQKATLNLWPGGNLICGQVTSGGSSVSEVDFYGGTLTPTFSSTTFFQGVTNAFVQNGGVTVDTTNLNITIAQPLLAAGSGGLTKIGTGTLSLIGANTYTGPTIVNAGKLVLGPAHESPGAITVNANSTLAFVQSSPPATVNVPSVTIGGGANSALEDDFSVTNAPAAIITNLILNGSVAVNVSGPVAVGRFPLFGYGTISGPGGLTIGQLPLGTVATLVTNTGAHTVDLVVSAVAQATWVGNINGNWDTATTNWLMSGTPIAFAQAANAVFNDSASNSAVSLTTNLSPSSVVVSNSALSYSFSGSGSLVGNMTLTKKGTNSLAINTADTFTGNVTISAGTLQLGSATALGSTANNVYVTNSGTLDINGNALGLEPVIVSGAGVNGLGALVNYGADQNNAYRNVTLTADVTFGGTGGTGLRTIADSDPGLVANGHNLTKVGSGQFNINGGTTVVGLTNVWTTDLGNVDIKQGTISFERRSTLGMTNNTITVEPGAAVQLFSLSQTLPPPVNSIVLTNATLLGNGATSGDVNTLASTITLNGSSNAINTTASTVLQLNGPIVGTGGVTFGTVTVAGTNTYTGPTTIAGGTLTLAPGALLTGTDSITIGTNGTLDVSAISPWTLGVGQTLGGGGTVNGSVIANGTLAPGNGTGTLTVNGDLTLAGNVHVQVNKSLAQSNDMASVSGALSNSGSGSVVVQNLGPALVVGDKFTLFNQPVSAGGALSVAGGGATWINNLASDGSVVVQSVGPTQPEPITVSVSGGHMNLSWPTIGWRLQVQTNSLSTGLGTNWAYWPNANTTNAVSIPISNLNPSVFVRLVYP